MDENVPKSLHTVSALLRMASWIAIDRGAELVTGEHVKLAMRALGLDEMTDAYGLEAKALKVLQS